MNEYQIKKTIRDLRKKEDSGIYAGHAIVGLRLTDIHGNEIENIEQFLSFDEAADLIYFYWKGGLLT